MSHSISGLAAKELKVALVDGLTAIQDAKIKMARCSTSLAADKKVKKDQNTQLVDQHHQRVSLKVKARAGERKVLRKSNIYNNKHTL